MSFSRPSGQNNGPTNNTKRSFAPQATQMNGKKRKREETTSSINSSASNSTNTDGVVYKNLQANTLHGLKQHGNGPRKDQPRPNTNTATKSSISEKSRVLLQSRAQLPIWSHASEIRKSLQGIRDVLLLVGETGSGKSTQVPQFLLSEPWCTGCIAITQPRRVAAVSLSRRVADEMGTTVGGTAGKVGYSVRFDNMTGPATKIKFLTEGMLLQEMLRDPWLTQYSAVVVDEVHERGVNVDLILGFLRRIVCGDKKGRKRVPLKTVVMSATADTKALYEFFDKGFRKDAHAEALGPTTGGVPMMNGAPKVNGNVAGHERDDAASESSWSGISTSEDSMAPEASHESQTHNLPLDNVKEVLSDHISTCHIQGRQFPVKVMYTPDATDDFAEAALKTIFQIHYKEPLPGDILVFVTGQDVVESLETLVNEHAAAMGPEVPKVLVLPLFAALSRAQQQFVFDPTPRNTRKVIISTNIAETSVTISGVRHVIDCGLAKIKEYRPQLGLDSLLVKPISQSSAIQRKGRAGREAPGHCYRLYTESEYLKMEPATVPEILRCDLASALLVMKARGIDDVLTFPFLSPPSPSALRKALLQLHRLGALSDSGAITTAGRSMSRLPLPPPLARVLIAASQPESNCVSDVIDIISCLTVESIFLPLTSEEKKEEAEAARAELHRREGDHLTLMATLQAFAEEAADRLEWCKKRSVSHRAIKNVLDVRKQLRAQCAQQKLLLDANNAKDDDGKLNNTAGSIKTVTQSIPERTDNILRAFLRGFSSNVARLMPDGSYRTMEGNQIVSIHPSSVLFGRKVEAILYNELVFTTKCYARGVSAVRMDWWGMVVGL